MCNRGRSLQSSGITPAKCPRAQRPCGSMHLWVYSPHLYPAAEGVKTAALKLSKQLPSTAWLWSPMLARGLRAALASPIPRAGCSPHVHTQIRAGSHRAEEQGVSPRTLLEGSTGRKTPGLTLTCRHTAFPPPTPKPTHTLCPRSRSRALGVGWCLQVSRRSAFHNPASGASGSTWGKAERQGTYSHAHEVGQQGLSRGQSWIHTWWEGCSPSLCCLIPAQSCASQVRNRAPFCDPPKQTSGSV